MGKLAIKRLTASDLTLFAWQFHNRNAGNQKAINLNADVFVGQLYPSLVETDAGRAGYISLDLFLYGPGNARAWNLQRKIIKGGTYKNWRLDGEFVPNPEDQPERFNVLVPGDYVIFDFEGDLYPTAARAVFVARSLPTDAILHTGLDDAGIVSMRAVDMAELHSIVVWSGTPESHPVHELLLDAAIEDAAQGGIEGTRRVLSRTTGRRITRAELERARQRADDVGREGEELLDGHFELQLRANVIHSYEWTSSNNAISPYDFTVTLHGGPLGKVEVKSTRGEFNQIIHLSVAQLLEMRDSAEPYELYRLYELDDRRAKLRIASDCRRFAEQVIAQFEALPTSVTVDGISVRPETLPFGDEIVIELPADGQLFAS